MRPTLQTVKQEATEIYSAIKQVMKKTGYDYCQSWWLNSKNFSLKSKLSTRQINQRAKLLVKEGYLIVDPENTSSSQGVRYKLTEKQFISL